MDGNTTTIELSDSILSSVKKLIGISEEDESFDLDIMININAAIAILFQVGAIPKSYTVVSKEDTYGDLIPNDLEKVPEDLENIINQIKMYLFYKTRLGFDSLTLSATVIEVLKESIKEIEWRLMDAFE